MDEGVKGAYVTREPIGQVDAQVVPRYGGFSTFARLPTERDVEVYDVGVIGIPFDAGVTYRTGARFGPSAIRQASRLLRPFHAASAVHPFGHQQVVDLGDVTANPFDIEAALAAIQEAVDPIATAGKRFVALGGDHTIALPLLRAVNAAHGPVALVHFDAHLDTWNTYFGAPYTHGTPFRRAVEEHLLEDGRSVHVGIRGPLYADTDLTEDAALGFAVLTIDDLADSGAETIAKQIRRVGDRLTYLSVDIDVLDPAHARAQGRRKLVA